MGELGWDWLDYAGPQAGPIPDPYAPTLARQFWADEDARKRRRKPEVPDITHLYHLADAELARLAQMFSLMGVPFPR